MREALLCLRRWPRLGEPRDVSRAERRFEWLMTGWAGGFRQPEKVKSGRASLYKVQSV